MSRHDTTGATAATRTSTMDNDTANVVATVAATAATTTMGSSSNEDNGKSNGTKLPTTKQLPEHGSGRKSSPIYDTDNNNNNGNDERDGDDDDDAHDENAKRSETITHGTPPSQNNQRADDEQRALSPPPSATLPKCQSIHQRTLRTNRTAPRRFVARPSKQGWGVDDGDEAFLNDDRRFFGDNNNNGGGANGGDAEGARDSEVDANDDDGTHSRSNYIGSVEQSDTGTRRNARRAKESRRATSRSNSASASATVASAAASAASAARPRGETKRTKKKSPSSASNSSSSSTPLAVPSWVCDRCGRENPAMRARCTKCQGWKGGRRDNIRNKAEKRRRKGRRAVGIGVADGKHDDGTRRSRKRKGSGDLRDDDDDGDSDDDDGENHEMGGIAKAVGPVARGRIKKRPRTISGGDAKTTNPGTAAVRRRATGSVATRGAPAKPTEGVNANKTNHRTRTRTRTKTTTTPTAASDEATTAAANNSYTMNAFRERKSNMSRRPRRLRITEKMRRMQEELARNSRTTTTTTTTTTTGGRSNGAVAAAAAAAASATMAGTTKGSRRGKSSVIVSAASSAVVSSPKSICEWQCTRCDHVNTHTRARCARCQGWRGGRREGYRSGRSSSSSPREKRTRRGGGGGTSEGSAVLCEAMGDDGTEVEATASVGIASGIGSKAVEDDANSNSPPKKRKKVAAVTAVAAAAVANSVENVGNKKGTKTKRRGSAAKTNKTKTAKGGSAGRLAAATPGSDGDGSNYDDVACCLCKCAVDFSDLHFFLPPETKSEAGCEEERRDEKGGMEEEFESHSDAASPDAAVSAVAFAASRDTDAGGHAAEVDATASNARRTAVSAVMMGNGDDHCEEKKMENVEEEEGMIAPGYVASTKAESDASNGSGAKVEEDATKTTGSSAPPAETTEDGAASRTLQTKEGVDPIEEGNVSSAVEKEGNSRERGDAKPLSAATQRGDIVADESEEEDEEHPPFRLPHRFHDPNNALILCDGPVHAGKRRSAAIGDPDDGSRSFPSSDGYRCERAYHQQCHFIPVLTIPRGPWRCLICRYRDEEYLKEKAARKRKKGGTVERGSGGSSSVGSTISDRGLNAIFRCVPAHTSLNTSAEKEEGTMMNALRSVSTVQGAASPSKVNVANAEKKPNSSSPLSLEEGPIKCALKSEEDAKLASRMNAGDGEETASSQTHSDSEKTKTTAQGSKPASEATLTNVKVIATTTEPATVPSSSTNNLENQFESLTAHLKSHLLHLELTTKSKATIRSALASIRTAEHSLRSFTETSKARKALAERIESGLGLPQELSQCVMRIAAAKGRVRGLLLGVEGAVRCRPTPAVRCVDLDSSMSVKREDDGSKAVGECVDVVGELMQWYRCRRPQLQNGNNDSISTAFTMDQTATTSAATSREGKSLLHHLFPEGHLRRRRLEPRTDEARVQDEALLRRERNAKNYCLDDGSSSGVSLDDLTCANCHQNHASDDNDMLLCDGIGCYRAFHMACLEPKLTVEDLAGDDDDNWFCPLCTAHATLVHYAQCEYLGDDWEELMKANDLKEWETASDVFPEAPFELRVAHKFKENNEGDQETREFLENTLGIVTGLEGSKEGGLGIDNNVDLEDEDEEDDDDFDQEEEAMDDCDSLAEDCDDENMLVNDKIGKDELDALSYTSEVGSNDDGDASSGEEDNHYGSGREGGGSGSTTNKSPPRRSKRRRYTLPGGKRLEESTSGDDSDERSGRSTDVGKLDVANIVHEKRGRTKVDYRKLADAMFGDESDEDAKGAKKEYTYRPKSRAARARKNHCGNDDEESDDGDDSDVGGASKENETKKFSSKNGKIESKKRHCRSGSRINLKNDHTDTNVNNAKGGGPTKPQSTDLPQKGAQ